MDSELLPEVDSAGVDVEDGAEDDAEVELLLEELDTELDSVDDDVEIVDDSVLLCEDGDEDGVDVEAVDDSVLDEEGDEEGIDVEAVVTVLLEVAVELDVEPDVPVEDEPVELVLSVPKSMPASK